jgi:uncharacterized protein (TIGR01244 family)
MPLTITKHSESFSSCPQISPHDIPEIIKLGYKTIINNRPDNEGGIAQPSSDVIKAAAEKAGLHYIHIPVTPNNITPSHVETCASFVDGAPTPILGFCKTGMRASSLYKSTQQSNNPSQNMAKQNWLTQKISYFFRNKCLLTKIYRKFAIKVRVTTPKDA